MNWGDELLGKKIEPEDWLGGLVADEDGHYHVLSPGWLASDDDPTWDGVAATILGSTPVFPPQEWAGKTDVEMWAELASVKDWDPHISVGDAQVHHPNVVRKGYGDAEGPSIYLTGVVSADYDREVAVSPQNVDGLIRDLQNALLLCQRMGWVR